MKHKLAVFDLDGTILQGDSFRLLIRRILIDLRWPFPRIALGSILRKMNLLDQTAFRELVLQSYRGWTKARLGKWMSEFVACDVSPGIRPNALEAIRRHRESTDRLVLATGAFDLYAQIISADLGFDEVICTTTEYLGDTFTGRLLSRPCLGEEKRNRIQKVARSVSNEGCTVTFYSDSYADLPSFYAADDPRPVTPDRRLYEIARQQAWHVQDW